MAKTEKGDKDNMDRLLRRVWAEIDLDALDRNVALIKEAAKGKRVMAVVKADAYGHCAELIAKELYRAGVDFFAVSNVLEALEIKPFIGNADILVLGSCDSEWQDDIFANSIQQTAVSVQSAKKISEYALSKGVTAKVHIKVNTGMSRVGIDTREELAEIMSLGGIEICGVYTHFSAADSLDPDSVKYTEMQQQKLLEVAQPAIEKGIPYYSQNSGGILYHSDFGGDIVRSGIITYGCKPDFALDVPLDIKPVMRLRAAVSQVRTIESGTAVSYGRTFVSDRKTELAVIPVGYADGYSRRLSNNGAVYINGKRAPICGRVCMDQMMVDVTGMGVKVGDTAEIYSDTIDEIKVDNIADRLGTIGYELLCCVSRRVPRVSIRNGKIEEVRCYI